jgi:hypothetical protein
LCRVAGLSCSPLEFRVLVTFGHVRCLFITVLAESEYTLAVKFDLESVKRVLAETNLNSGSLFILRLPILSVSLLSSPSWNRCLFVIKSELNSMLVESESELCTRGNNLYTPTLSRKSVCGDVLTCIPLFIESVFEVPLKTKTKKKIKDHVAEPT